MKHIISILALLGVCTLGVSGHAMDWLEPVSLKDCPGKTYVAGDLVVCKKVKDWVRVWRAVVDYDTKVKKLPKKLALADAGDLGILPDDSTDRLYLYVHPVVALKKKKAGYVAIEGYANSEMESRWQMTTRYNLDGSLVSVQFAEK